LDFVHCVDETMAFQKFAPFLSKAKEARYPVDPLDKLFSVTEYHTNTKLVQICNWKQIKLTD